MGSFKKIAKNLLIENFWDRKFGEPLPTLNDVAEKHQIEKKEPVVNEGKKAATAYNQMNKAVTTAIYGIKNMRKLIDDAPYNPKFGAISANLYKFEIDLEKKLRTFIPQIRVIANSKMLESVDKYSLRETFERIGGK